MGTRSGLIWYTRHEPDHPHAYGDKEVSDIADEMSDGSSPRVWGQGIYDKANADKVRIIPTRMGTSYTNHNIMTV